MPFSLELMVPTGCHRQPLLRPFLHFYRSYTSITVPINMGVMVLVSTMR